MKAKKIETQATDKALAGKEKMETKKMILKPRITEKASMQSDVNAYTFVVSSNATKLTIKDELKKDYKVTPLHINITNLPSKKVFVKGKWGVKSSMKKAIVYLKKGDSIKLN